MLAKPIHRAVGIVAAIVVGTFVAFMPGRPTANDILVAGWNALPHTTDDVSGREAEIIRHVMGRCGYSVQFATFPFMRHWIAFLQGRVDAVATVPGRLGPELPGTRTLSHIYYENGVLVRAADGLRIHRICDLQGLRIVSFAGASTLLPEIQAIAGVAESYLEVGDLSEQISLLLTGRVDAVYADGRLLAEAAYQMRQDAATRLRLHADQQLRFVPIARSLPFHVVFRDRALAHAFNRCLMTARLAGEIDVILARFDERLAAMFPEDCVAGADGDACESHQSRLLTPAAGISLARPDRGND